MRTGAEYRSSDPQRDRVRWQERVLFLRALAELVPGALKSLEEEVLPSFKEAWEATLPPLRVKLPTGPLGEPVEVQDPPPWIQPWRAQDSLLGGDVGRVPQLRNLREALLTWTESFELHDAWLLDVALRTLRILHQRPEALAEFGAGGFAPPYFPYVGWAPTFSFEFPGWIPELRTYADYAQALDAAFAKAKQAYLAERRDEAEVERRIPASDLSLDEHLAERRMTSRLERNPARHDRGKTHFEWLVLYQVRRLSYSMIAHKYGRGNRNPSGDSGKPNVLRAVRNVAQRIGLTLRDPAVNQHT